MERAVGTLVEIGYRRLRYAISNWQAGQVSGQLRDGKTNKEGFFSRVAAIKAIKSSKIMAH